MQISQDKVNKCTHTFTKSSLLLANFACMDASASDFCIAISLAYLFVLFKHDSLGSSVI